MRRVGLGDHHIAAAYARDSERLLVWLTRRTYDAQLAVVLVGETYARALSSRRAYRGDPEDAEALAAWTWGIARNALHEALRRGRAERRALRRLGVEPPLLEPAELRRIEELAELGSLRAALAARSASCRPSSARPCACASSTSSTTRPSRRASASSSRRRGRASRGRCARWPARSTSCDRRGRRERARARRDPRRARRCAADGVGTHEALFAPEPPAPPPELRAPGAVDPSHTGTPVYVAQGAAWKLSASLCQYGAERVVGVFLTVPGGGAGARCDGARPEALAGRRIHTYFDPQTGTSWVFGTLPAAAPAGTVAVTEGGAGSSVRVAARPSDPRAVAKGRLPRGPRVFVAELAGAPEVRGVTATGAGGRQVLRCEGGRCSP